MAATVWIALTACTSFSTKVEEVEPGLYTVYGVHALMGRDTAFDVAFDAAKAFCYRRSARASLTTSSGGVMPPVVDGSFGAGAHQRLFFRCKKGKADRLRARRKSDSDSGEGASEMPSPGTARLRVRSVYATGGSLVLWEYQADDRIAIRAWGTRAPSGDLSDTVVMDFVVTGGRRSTDPIVIGLHADGALRMVLDADWIYRPDHQLIRARVPRTRLDPNLSVARSIEVRAGSVSVTLTPKARQLFAEFVLSMTAGLGSDEPDGALAPEPIP